MNNIEWRLETYKHLVILVAKKLFTKSDILFISRLNNKMYLCRLLNDDIPIKLKYNNTPEIKNE